MEIDLKYVSGATGLSGTGRKLNTTAGSSADSGMRIVCLAPDMLEIVYALGFGKSIVGRSAYTDYPPDALRRGSGKRYAAYYGIDASDFDAAEELTYKIATVSGFYDCNYEIIGALRPTLILGSEEAQQPMVETLTEKGYNAHCFTHATLGEVYDAIIAIGRLLGAEEKARSIVSGYYADIEKIKAVTSALTPVPVYFEIAHRRECAGYGTFGPYTMACGTPFEEMLQIAGGRNIFHDFTGSYIEVGYEEIVRRNPAVILSPCWPGAMDGEITTLREIMTREGFETTDAVKTGRVLYYDSGLMKHFGPRSITAIKKLAYLLHPDYFKNPKDSATPWELGRIDVF